MRRLILIALLASTTALAGDLRPARSEQPIKVVYHVADGTEQAARALANVRNELRAAPDTRIVVVALADGIRFLLKDAHDPGGKAFEPAVDALVAQGVEFRICMNTLTAHDVPLSHVIGAATPVPSGVAELARLQAREGFVYLRP